MSWTCNARTFDSVPLGEDEYVVSSDEKASVQARCRCHPTLAPGRARARAMRVNHEYGRGGALAYLAAYDVHRAEVFARCEPKTGIVPFMNLVTQVMTTEPYASAKRVFWIVDNGSSHRGKKAIGRLTRAFPNAVMVHTLVHASWTNQIEIFFSIVQRKAVQPNDFPPRQQPLAFGVQDHTVVMGLADVHARPDLGHGFLRFVGMSCSPERSRQRGPTQRYTECSQLLISGRVVVRHRAAR